MTKQSGVIKGLHDQECEHGNVAKWPPISFVPVQDKIQDALNINHKEHLQKIQLPIGTELNVTIWHTGMPEEFLNHVKQALHACDHMGFFDSYKKALEACVKVVHLHGKASSELATAQKKKLGKDIIKGLCPS